MSKLTQQPTEALTPSKGCNFKILLKTYKTFAPCTIHLKPPCTGRQSCSCPASLRAGPAGASPLPASPEAAAALGQSWLPAPHVESPLARRAAPAGAMPVGAESRRQQVRPVRLHPRHPQPSKEVPAPFSLQTEQNKKGFQKEKCFRWLFAVSQEQLLPGGAHPISSVTAIR